MDLNVPHENRPILNAFGKYILMDTGVIGFLNHKFYGKRHARKPLLLCLNKNFDMMINCLLALSLPLSLSISFSCVQHARADDSDIIDSPINKMQIKIGSNHITKAKTESIAFNLFAK